MTTLSEDDYRVLIQRAAAGMMHLSMTRAEFEAAADRIRELAQGIPHLPAAQTDRQSVQQMNWEPGGWQPGRYHMIYCPHRYIDPKNCPQCMVRAA